MLKQNLQEKAKTVKNLVKNKIPRASCKNKPIILTSTSTALNWYSTEATKYYSRFQLNLLKSNILWSNAHFSNHSQDLRSVERRKASGGKKTDSESNSFKLQGSIKAHHLNP